MRQLQCSAAALLVLGALAGSAYAQQTQGHQGGHAATAAAPYAGYETRPIKALSPEKIADLRAGRGMGLALAAELNGYPGPTHVVEHAAALGLSDSQTAEAQELLAAMKAETVPLRRALA